MLNRNIMRIENHLKLSAEEGHHDILKICNSNMKLNVYNIGMWLDMHLILNGNVSAVDQGFVNDVISRKGRSSFCCRKFWV